MTLELEPARLLWACRRGMLELDILLTKFLHDRYPSISSEEQKLFVRFLEENDQDLFSWLVKREKPLKFMRA